MNYRVENNRVINDKGEVAVIYHCDDYGWFTSHKDCPECVLDTDCVIDILENEAANVAGIARHKWPDQEWAQNYTKSLYVKWVPQGELFFIDPLTDWGEHVILLKNVKLFVA